MRTLEGRGQVDVIGVFLTGIVVSTAGTFGVFCLTSTLEQSAATPADVDVVATDRGGTTTLTVRHTVGETRGDGQVILRSRDGTHELPHSFVGETRWTVPIAGAFVGVRLDVFVVEKHDGSGLRGPRDRLGIGTHTERPAVDHEFRRRVVGDDRARLVRHGRRRARVPQRNHRAEWIGGRTGVTGSVGDVGQRRDQFDNLDGGTDEVEIVVRDTGGSQVSETTTVTVESGGNGSGGNGGRNGKNG